MDEFDNKTCARLEVQEGIDNLIVNKSIFVKSEWKPNRLEPTSFSLSVSDGHRAWTFDGSESFVEQRAEAWDKKVSWVMEKLQFYLSVGQPGVTYRFTKVRDIDRKLSFDIEDKESYLSLTANFLMLMSDPENVTSDLLGFLHSSNCQLTESYLIKCRSFDRMTRVNEGLEEQNKRVVEEKNQLEVELYKKFVDVLLTKKSKLREQRKEIEKLSEKIEKLMEKVQEDVERSETTSNSSSDDEEQEIEYQKPTPEKRMQGGEGSSGKLVTEVDPDATQPFLGEMETDVQIDEPRPQTDGPSTSVLTLFGDAPYQGIARKRRRN